jgi:TM2 domain-containing membrane protein YozV
MPKFCPRCGTTVEGTAQFCRACGSTLPPAQTGQEQPTREYPPTEYPPPPSFEQSQSSYPPPGYQLPSDYSPAPQSYPQPYGYQATPGVKPAGADKKLAAGLCGILIGGLGIHKFILGYNTEGLIMLLVALLTCGFGAIITGVVGLIEGIIYLTKSDEEFVNTYVLNKKGWF